MKRRSAALARLGPPRFPTPIGVFTAVERPRYEEALNQQVASAKAKAPPDLQALLNRGDTWVVRPETMSRVDKDPRV